MVSVFDRGFLYGDGLFETIRVCGGRPFRWAQHIDRTRRGAEFLRLALPFDGVTLRERALELIQQNAMPECLLRLSVSRGIGPRGYSPKEANSPTVVMALQPLRSFDAENPPRFRIVTSSIRVSKGDPLGGFKTSNKLLQILARAEADDRGMDEALLLDADGAVVEASSSNIFWIEGKTVCTTPLASGALPGVAREVVLELCHHLKIASVQATAMPLAPQQSGGVMLTNSSLGVIEVGELDGVAFRPSQLIREFQAAYRELMLREAGRE